MYLMCMYNNGALPCIGLSVPLTPRAAGFPFRTLLEDRTSPMKKMVETERFHCAITFFYKALLIVEWKKLPTLGVSDPSPVHRVVQCPSISCGPSLPCIPPPLFPHPTPGLVPALGHHGIFQTHLSHTAITRYTTTTKHTHVRPPSPSVHFPFCFVCSCGVWAEVRGKNHNNNKGN